jgi:hypothetical protein
MEEPVIENQVSEISNNNEKPKRGGKTIIIISVVVVALIIVLAIFLFANQKKESNPISGLNFIDCGISSAKIDMQNSDEYIPDIAAICFGDYVLKDCTESKIIMNDDGEEYEIKTMGLNEDGACKLKFTDLRDNENNGLHVDCVYPKEVMDSLQEATDETDKSKGDITVALFFATSLDTLSGKFCQGPLADAIVTQLRGNTGSDVSSENCTKDEATEKAKNLLNALKEGDLSNYQDACGHDYGLCSESSFNEKKDRYSDIDEFTIAEVYEEENSIRIRFNEKVEITTESVGTFDQIIYLTYDFEGCKLSAIQG